RCTSRMALVHARPLPAVLGLGPVLDDEVAEYGTDEADEAYWADEDEDGDGITLDHTPDAPEPDHPGGTDSEDGESAGPVLADTVVVSTPAATAELAATLDALGDLDRDIARAVAGAVVERLRTLVSPSVLAHLGEEIVRALHVPADEPVDETVPGR
ncbi:MAG TPA: hypothetical protein VH479_11695, partial [Acidimicrobiales bacterium]